MIKVFKSSLLVGMLAAMVFGQITQQNDHVYNASFVNRAYELSSAKETEYFSVIDGQMSVFWRAWATTGLPALDKIDLDYADHYTWGVEGDNTDDVQLNMRFAYSTQGVYILFEVFDNNWVGYVSAADYENDAVELFAEGHSAEDLYGAASTYFPCLSDLTFPHQLTETYSQTQVRFGGPELVEEFSFNYWRPDLVGLPVSDCSPGSGGDGLIQYNRTMTFSAAEATYGIMIEILPQEGNWRRQEWLVPWAIWGGPNANLTSRSSGEKVGLAIGYNDLDIGQLQATALRWRRADPYTEALDGTSVDCWGDILFDDNFDDILSTAGVTWDDVAGTPVSRQHGSIAQIAKVVKTEYYTVDGQRIDMAAGQLRNRTANVVLQKQTFTDNSTRTVRVPLSTVK